MTRDSLGRRSRFMRQPTGKRIVLTDRDIEILRLLYRYRYLGSTQLVAFLHPKSEKRFQERLGILFHETGLIDRPPVQWRYFDPLCSSVIYELSSHGLALLDDQYGLPPRATTLSRRSNNRKQQFVHAQMIVNTLVTIELETIETPDQRFVCVDEILARAPVHTRAAKNPLAVPVTIEPCPEFPDLHRPWHTHVIPDALYGIEYLIDRERRYRFWAVECEHQGPVRRSKISASSRLRKQAAYNALIKSGGFKTHWSIPNLKLHVVDRPSSTATHKMCA